MNTPNNIILIIVDSLRYDSVYVNQRSGLKYVEKNGIRFHEARSGGCWTLPSTTSIFTGLMPHQHQATSQTRSLSPKIPTLAEKLKSVGYQPYQITGNMVTTDIFGVDRGFSQTIKIWNHIVPRVRKSTRFLMLLSRPRIRKEIMSGGLFNVNNVSQYLKAGAIWAQMTYNDIFLKMLDMLKTNETRGEKSFFFLNLMESHFPYHVDTTFKLSGNSLVNRVQEIAGLYHTINQSFLTKKKDWMNQRTKGLLKRRQRRSWQLIRRAIDEFVRELHEDKNNLVILASDHGDNFGEQGWHYHFSNVTDAGNHVPLYWLGYDHPQARSVYQPVSLTALHNSILQASGIPNNGPTLFEDRADSLPILQSYWYNNHGRTLPEYRFNQLCFLNEQARCLLRNNKWYWAQNNNSNEEPVYQFYPGTGNPIDDIIQDREQKEFLHKTAKEFLQFSESILP